MEKFYSWCTSLNEKFDDRYSRYFEDYFRETSVCLNVFIVGLVSALTIAAIYYFIICNKSFALAKRYVWAMTVFITFLTSLIISGNVIIGKDGNGNPDDSTGIYYVSYNTEAYLLNQAGNNMEERQDISNTAEEYRESLRYGVESLPMEIALVNAFYSILFYLLFSLLFKKHTTHGKAIPW